MTAVYYHFFFYPFKIDYFQFFNIFFLFLFMCSYIISKNYLVQDDTFEYMIITYEQCAINVEKRFLINIFSKSRIYSRDFFIIIFSLNKSTKTTIFLFHYRIVVCEAAYRPLLIWRHFG